jgi:hypothetical protein
MIGRVFLSAYPTQIDRFSEGYSGVVDGIDGTVKRMVYRDVMTG